MTAPTISLRPTVPEDVPFIIHLQNLPSSGHFLTPWTAEQPLSAIDDPVFASLIGIDADGAPIGCVIFADIDEYHGNVCLMRIVVEQPGRGIGGALLDTAVDGAFDNTPVYRLWLGVLVENSRAKHVYERHGFTQEGVFRQPFDLPGGGRTDCVVLSLLRPEWSGKRASSARRWRR